MHLSTPLSVLAALAPLATAIPTTSPAAAGVTVYNPQGLDKRAGILSIELRHQYDCLGDYPVVEAYDEGCVNVEGATRSVKYHINNGYYNCKVMTWAGKDCRGSSFTLQWEDVGKCFNVLYASVSWACTLK